MGENLTLSPPAIQKTFVFEVYYQRQGSCVVGENLTLSPPAIQKHLSIAATSEK